MLLKIAKTTVLVTLASCALNASSFNAQAEKDRLALIKYFEAKFEDPLKNRNKFFPYSTDDELKNGFITGLKHKDFAKGNYAFNKDGREQYEEINEMPPYEDAIDDGEALYNKKFKNGKSFASCFPNTQIAGEYPKFDDKKKEVITLGVAINRCLTSNGEKAWKMKKGNMASLQAYFASQSKEAEKKINRTVRNKGQKGFS